MAQKVGYFQDDVVFTEGPFVMVNANGWRVEVQHGDVGCNCIMPDLSIMKLKPSLGWPGKGKTDDTAAAEAVVDKLNAMVREGKIVKTENETWVVA